MLLFAGSAAQPWWTPDVDNPVDDGPVTGDIAVDGLGITLGMFPRIKLLVVIAVGQETAGEANRMRRPLIALFRASGRDDRDSERERLDREARRARALRRTRVFAVNDLGVRISGGNTSGSPQNA